jgi:hypothetical protein
LSVFSLCGRRGIYLWIWDIHSTRIGIRLEERTSSIGPRSCYERTYIFLISYAISVAISLSHHPHHQSRLSSTPSCISDRHGHRIESRIAIAMRLYCTRSSTHSSCSATTTRSSIPTCSSIRSSSTRSICSSVPVCSCAPVSYTHLRAHETM